MERDMRPSTQFKVELFQDEEDANLTVWERQLRVSKFMVDNGVKHTICKYLAPVYDAQ